MKATRTSETKPSTDRPQSKKREPSRGLAVGGILSGLLLLAALGFALANHGAKPQTLKAHVDTLSITNDPRLRLMPKVAEAAPSRTTLTNLDAMGKLLNQGTELLAKGEVEGARLRFEEALKLNPDDEDAHYNLAVALAKLGKSEQAKEQYREALRLYPDYTEAHINLGNLLVAEGNMDEAISHFKIAIRAAPDDATAQNSLGHALARQKHFDEAIDCFRKAIRTRPTYAEAHYNLGTAYLLQHKFNEAIAELESALALKPDFEPAARELAKAKEQLAASRQR